MSLGDRRNPFTDMSDEQLSIELVQVVKFCPLTENGQMLLMTIGQRLCGTVQTKTDRPVQAGEGTLIRGINLAEKSLNNGEAWDEVTNLIKDAVHAVRAPHVDANIRTVALNQMLTDIDVRVSIDRLKLGQLYVQLDLELTTWRVFIDLPSHEPNTLIRHYITPGEYYAYHVDFLNPPTNNTPYNLIPPSWDKGEKWDSIRVNFDGDEITHRFTTPSTGGAIGSYICDLRGVIEMREPPQIL